MTFQFFKLGLHDKPSLTTKFFNFGLREFSILGSKNKTANTDISRWIQSHYILVFKVGLQDKPTLTLKFQY